MPVNVIKLALCVALKNQEVLKMFVVWHKERKKYVGKKERHWPRRRFLVPLLQDAQVYKSKGAIKNSIGLNTSNIPGKNKKVLPPWAEILEIRLDVKEK